MRWRVLMATIWAAVRGAFGTEVRFFILMVYLTIVLTLAFGL